MKQVFSAILSAILAICLLTGCETAQEANVTLPAESLAITEAPASIRETPPETTLPEEPAKCLYPAAMGEEGITFPCLIENHEDKVYTLDSLKVVAYSGETSVNTTEYTGAELEAFGAWDDTGLVLNPADAVLQIVPASLPGDRFDWAELTFTLLDALGQERVQSFAYTTQSEQVNALFVDDTEVWDCPFLENGNYWSFRYVITNLLPRDITLTCVYSVEYLDGMPVSTRTYSEKDFGRYQLTGVKSLSPGESAGWSEGFGTEFMRDGLTSIRKTFVYRDSEGELYTQVFRFTLDEQRASQGDSIDHQVWVPAAIQGEQWVFDMMLTNDTPDTLVLDTVWYTECVDNYFSSSWHEEDVSDLVLKSGDSFHWKHHEDLDWPKYNQKVFSCVFHNTTGEQVVQSFRFGLNRELAEILPEVETDDSRYSAVVDLYCLPSELGMPQYTAGEIRQMIDSELTLEEVAEKISTYADLVQYLYLKGFSTLSVPDSNFHHGGYQWQCSRSAQDAFDRNGGGCGERANLCNYILSGDYDEQGYIADVANEGGHLFNYFKEDGIYYFCDIGTIIAGGNYDNAFYRISATEDPTQFAQNRIRDNHTYTSDDYYSHLVMLYMYPYDGPSRPVGFQGGPANVLSAEIEEITTILYCKEDSYAPIFAEDITEELWPAEAR